MEIKVTIESNKEEVLKAVDEAIQKGLEECGLLAEGFAKKVSAVDTGLMRNSVTHALSGVPFSHDYQDDAGEQSGSISGEIGAKTDHEMYLGTNVEYAPYVEYGTTRMEAQPFIRPAIENHQEEYKRIMEGELKRYIE